MFMCDEMSTVTEHFVCGGGDEDLAREVVIGTVLELHRTIVSRLGQLIYYSNCST